VTSDASAWPAGPHRLRIKVPPPPPRRQWWRMWLVGPPLITSMPYQMAPDLVDLEAARGEDG